MALPIHSIKCDGAPTLAPTQVNQHWLDTSTGDIYFSNGTASVANWIKSDIGDTKVKVSANDTTTDHLISKIVAGSNISIVELNDGANETLEINSTTGGREVTGGIDGGTILAALDGPGPYGKFFKFGTNHTQTSDVTPFVMAFDGFARAITINNKNNNSDVNILFYKNGSLVYTWELSNFRYARISTADVPAVLFVRGDLLSIECENPGGGSSEPDDLQLYLYMRYTSDESEEVVTPTL